MGIRAVLKGSERSEGVGGVSVGVGVAPGGSEAIGGVERILLGLSAATGARPSSSPPAARGSGASATTPTSGTGGAEALPVRVGLSPGGRPRPGIEGLACPPPGDGNAKGARREREGPARAIGVGASALEPRRSSHGGVGEKAPDGGAAGVRAGGDGR